jgi:acetoin utilization deacetylase AcuC-like enzyme
MAARPAVVNSEDMKTFYSDKMVCDLPDLSFSPSAGKPRAVVRSWRAAGIPVDLAAPKPATLDELSAAHDRGYVSGVLEGRIRNGFGNTRPEVAATLPYTTGAMLTAARWVLSNGSVAAAPCSGFHHAGFARADGFCTFNGLMVTAIALHAEGLVRRVGILDFDQHYGDGTDEILETLGIDWVRHVTAGERRWTPAEVPSFMAAIEPWIEAMADCDLLLYQAGADPHIDDPLGGWLTTDELRERDRRVFRAAQARGLAVVWNLAGGYQKPLRKVLDIHDNTARECVAAWRDGGGVSPRGIRARRAAAF